MKFVFTDKKVDLPNSVHYYAEKKVGKLDRFFKEDASAAITFSVEKVTVDKGKKVDVTKSMTLTPVKADKKSLKWDSSDKTIAIFGHGGHSTAIFAHMMNIPFPLACHLLRLDFTNISLFHFGGNVGEFTTPRFDMIGNAEHIRGLEAENTFMQ